MQWEVSLELLLATAVFALSNREQCLGSLGVLSMSYVLRRDFF